MLQYRHCVCSHGAFGLVEKVDIKQMILQKKYIATNCDKQYSGKAQDALRLCVRQKGESNLDWGFSDCLSDRVETENQRMSQELTRTEDISGRRGNRSKAQRYKIV